MKTNPSLLLLFVLVSLTATAQNRNDVFDAKVPVNWLGLEFSKARFIGDRERLGSESDMRHLLEAWNELILTERDKYKIHEAILRTEELNPAVRPVEERNADLDVLSLYSPDPKDYFHLKAESVRAIATSYNYKTLNGIGLMFVVEAFSKINNEAAIWVTFIDMKSKEVLFTERITGKPKGFGLRNYWAGAVYDIIKQIEKKEYEMWRKKYYRG